MTAPRPIAMRATLVIGGAALLVLAGCSHRYSAADGSDAGAGGVSGLLGAGPTAGGPDLPGGRLFYPLQVGNHWDWRIRVVNQVTTDAGPQPPDTTEQPWAGEIVGTAQAGTREYFIQAEYDPRVVLVPPATGFLMREDRLGLYDRDPGTGPDVSVEGQAPADPIAAGLAASVDRSVGDGARRAAYARAATEVAEKISIIQLGPGPNRRRRTGADPGEITMLSFPLRVGASWIVRDSPRFTRTVVSHDLIRVPLGTLAAWRIRGESELFGPNDRVHFWYSPLGLVRIRYHIESDAVDNTGQVIGRVAQDFDQSLTGVRLDTPRGLVAAGAAPPR